MMTNPEWMLSGAIATAALVIALLFLRFWRAGRDPLFAWFAAAFVLQAVSRLVPLFLEGDGQEIMQYALRLLAYLMIVAAIWSKNRSVARTAGSREPH